MTQAGSLPPTSSARARPRGSLPPLLLGIRGPARPQRPSMPIFIHSSLPASGSRNLNICQCDSFPFRLSKNLAVLDSRAVSWRNSQYLPMQSFRFPPPPKTQLLSLFWTRLQGAAEIFNIYQCDPFGSWSSKKLSFYHCFGLAGNGLADFSMFINAIRSVPSPEKLSFYQCLFSRISVIPGRSQRRFAAAELCRNQAIRPPVNNLLGGTGTDGNHSA